MSSNIKSIVFTGQCVHDIDLLAEEIIMIPSNDVQIIQECHDIISHIVCELVEEIVDLKTVNEWEQIKNEFKNGYKFLILDRDGVVNITKPNGYISSFSEFVFTDGFKSNIKLLSECFDRIFITTNQAGIGKGIMTENELLTLHECMLSEIKKLGGSIDKVYYSKGIDDTDKTRKPNTGMAENIKRDFPDIDFSKTIVVGDSFADRLFANRINAKFILVQ